MEQFLLTEQPPYKGDNSENLWSLWSVSCWVAAKAADNSPPGSAVSAQFLPLHYRASGIIRQEDNEMCVHITAMRKQA